MTELVRLSKRMSELGLSSRREADEWIARGWVRVDGEVISELGSKVLPHQKITVERQAAAEQSKRVTILINKPMGYVSGQAEDGYTPAVALIKPENHWPDDPSTEQFHPTQLRSLVPAGRLDIDSVGLLVLTQDGRVAKTLIGEETSIEKEYLVRVEYTREGKLPESDLKKLCFGLWMDGKPLLPAKVRWQNDDQLSFTLKQGRKRQIRRMCDMVGLKVVGLKRVRIGKVKLGDLPVGQWRYLRPEEQF
jgi:23S rRNA pseudouridine2604 synthase